MQFDEYTLKKNEYLLYILRRSKIHLVSVSQTFAEAEYLHTFNRQVLCCFVHFLSTCMLKFLSLALSHLLDFSSLSSPCMTELHFG